MCQLLQQMFPRKITHQLSLWGGAGHFHFRKSQWHDFSLEWRRWNALHKFKLRHLVPFIPDFPIDEISDQCHFYKSYEATINLASMFMKLGSRINLT